jgi:hypothetical protein
MTRDRGLIVLGGRERLALFGRYRGVAVNQPGEHPGSQCPGSAYRRSTGLQVDCRCLPLSSWVEIEADGLTVAQAGQACLLQAIAVDGGDGSVTVMPSRKDQALDKEVAPRTDPSSDPTTGADLSGDNMPTEWLRDHIHISTGAAGNFGGFHPIRHKTGELRVARFIAAPKQKA